VRYRTEQGKHGFSDGGSRVGVDGRYQFLPGKWVFARGEAGFNLLDEINALFNGGGNADDTDGGRGDTFFRRLLYAGYESPNLFVVFGKTWSTYYKVTSFTDRFFGTGGKAAGTYNAGTDGGYTGTGRAENALQTRLNVDFLSRQLGLEPFQLNVQVQDGEPIPQIDGQRYGHALGLSAMLVTRDDFSFGVAYNHARVPNNRDPELRARGIHGNATALALGARWFDDDWYLATVIARLRNQMTTDQGNYFDGLGWELYAQYRLKGKWWLTGGWNWLRPDGGQALAGDYRVKFAVVGLRYALQDFDRVLYVNLRGDRSLTADGSGTGNVVTVGLRWAF
jgi:predicted porin